MFDSLRKKLKEAVGKVSSKITKEDLKEEIMIEERIEKEKEDLVKKEDERKRLEREQLAQKKIEEARQRVEHRDELPLDEPEKMREEFEEKIEHIKGELADEKQAELEEEKEIDEETERKALYDEEKKRTREPVIPEPTIENREKMEEISKKIEEIEKKIDRAKPDSYTEDEAYIIDERQEEEETRDEDGIVDDLKRRLDEREEIHEKKIPRITEVHEIIGEEPPAARPVKVVKPSKPVEPIESIKPIEMVEPIEPVELPKPVKHTEHDKHAKSVEPVETVIPFEFAKSAESYEHVRPDEIFEPAKPAKRAEPAYKEAEEKKPVVREDGESRRIERLSQPVGLIEVDDILGEVREKIPKQHAIPIASEVKKIAIEEEREIREKAFEGEEPLEELFEEGPRKRGLFSKIFEKTITEDDAAKIMKELEMALLENDVALEVAEKIGSEVKEEIISKNVRRGKVEELIRNALRSAMLDVMKQEKLDIEKMIEHKDGVFTVMFLGFNGVGKTTTLAKFSSKFKKFHPFVAAGDTFRAASIEQLEVHAERAGFRLIKHNYGDDSAAVIFDAKKAAKAAGSKLVLADTAGRSHSNVNLMDELKKVVRVNNPDLKILVLDALTGNDIYEQSRLFNDAVGVDAIILTKADVYDKGGAALSAAYTIKKPIIYLGVGQDYGDLKEFNPKEIVNQLLKD